MNENELLTGEKDNQVIAVDLSDFGFDTKVTSIYKASVAILEKSAIENTRDTLFIDLCNLEESYQGKIYDNLALLPVITKETQLESLVNAVNSVKFLHNSGQYLKIVVSKKLIEAYEDLKNENLQSEALFFFKDLFEIELNFRQNEKESQTANANNVYYDKSFVSIL